MQRAGVRVGDLVEHGQRGDAAQRRPAEAGQVDEGVLLEEAIQVRAVAQVEHPTGATAAEQLAAAVYIPQPDALAPARESWGAGTG